jgi:hypothetical protein
MNRESRAQWINAALDDVFLAVIAWEPLRDALIFKGARVLNLYLGESRQSLDIDSNIAPELAMANPNVDAQASFLEQQLPQALRRYFEHQNPVKYKLVGVKVGRNPPKGHIRGWNQFKLKIEVQDNSLAGILGLPKLEIEVAAQESLGPNAVQMLNIHGISAKVYALHRIAGEKLRAYLTSLPPYRRKMKGGDREFRVKDLHDIARILQARPAADAVFWAEAGQEFLLACESRLVDCRGLESFMENWPQARERYETDGSLAKISFDEAEQALKTVVGLLEQQKIFPLDYPVQ